MSKMDAIERTKQLLRTNDEPEPPEQCQAVCAGVQVGASKATYHHGKQCPFNATEDINGRKLCWVHAQVAKDGVREQGYCA